MATVKRHMPSDVRVGSFLSGGVDSAAVTAAMAKQATSKITEFTIGFPGNPIDETAATSTPAAKCATVLIAGGEARIAQFCGCGDTEPERWRR